MSAILPTPFQKIRSSCLKVAEAATHVTINSQSIFDVGKKLVKESTNVCWDFEGIHYNDGGDLTVQYILVLDTLNFCFWPDSKFDYDDLAKGLRTSLEENPSALDAELLATIDAKSLRLLVRWPSELPLEEERVRLLQETANVLLSNYGGKAANLVKSANKSAAELVKRLTADFPGFRDEAIYKGSQIFLYKRAQIFVADLWGAFKGNNFGTFADVHEMTMFADYQVPVFLRENQILSYSEHLSLLIDNKKIVFSGSEEEIEIRASSILAVEKLRECMEEYGGKKITSIELDWILWSQSFQLHSPRPHHRVKSIFY